VLGSGLSGRTREICERQRAPFRSLCVCGSENLTTMERTTRAGRDSTQVDGGDRIVSKNGFITKVSNGAI